MYAFHNNNNLHEGIELVFGVVCKRAVTRGGNVDWRGGTGLVVCQR